MSASILHTPLSVRKSPTRTISVTSGKGGVGKTTLIANLAVKLGKMGHKVLVLDGDLGMANVDIVFGIRPSLGITSLLEGEKSIHEVVTEVAENVYLIPGGSGIYDLQYLNVTQKRILLDQINQLEGVYDYMLIDTAPGIDDKVLFLNSAAHEILVVVTPDPSSLTDAYALIKVLNQRHRETRFSVVCNMVRDESEALRVFQRLSDVTQKFLCVSLNYKGFIPLDRELRLATKRQQVISLTSPRCPSSFALQSLAEKLNGYNELAGVKGGMQFFWEQLIGVA